MKVQVRAKIWVYVLKVKQVQWESKMKLIEAKYESRVIIESKLNKCNEINEQLCVFV